MIDLTVKTLDSRNHAFSLEDDQITVRGFKEYIAEFVAVPADSQRLIYCGRVLQDEKKLNDYDVNGKVIHLVQRAPPQPGQRGNDGALGQAQRGEPVWQTLQRTYYRLTRAQMHGNATYVGAMSVPAEIVEGHELPVPQLSNTLSNSRLIVARRMLNRANELMSRLDDPNCPLNPPASESNQPSLAQQVQVQELETEHEYDNEGRNNYGDRLLEAVVAAALSVAEANNVTLFRGNNDDSGESTETRAGNDSNDDSQSDTQQQQPQQPQQQQQQQQPQQPQQQQQQQQQGEQQGSTSNGAGQSNRPQTLTPPPPRPPQMAELLERVLEAQTLLRPYLERYRVLMHADPSLPPGAGPDGVEGNQRIIDGVSETLHYMSHAFHALSDIIVDMGQQPPRNLRCRPIIIQHSAILQPNIPIQVEAHISLHGRNAVNNNGNEETADSASTVGQSESGEGNAEDASQQQGSENASQQQSEQQPQPEPRASPFVFNLPNNVEVLMEVSPEGNIDSASGGEQPQTGENNNNTNNVGSMSGGDTFPWGAAGSPPDFIRNLIQAVAADVQQSNITATTITSRNPSSTNSAQSTQARSNVGTHPTTATQTRSTSRPHVFHHQQTYPLGIGMTIGQGLDFDPFLPCNSHHVHRTSTTTSSTVTSASQGTRASQVSVSETPTPAQTATTSTTANNTGSTNTTASTTSQTNASNNPLINLQQQILGGTSGQPLAGILNSNSPDLAELVMQMLDDENIHVAIIGNRGRRTLAELFGSGAGVDLFAPQNSTNQGNFLTNLSVLVAQNMTLEGTIRLRIGQWEPIASLRRPLQDFLQHSFPNTTTEGVQEQATEMLLSQFRPYFQNLLTADEDGSNGNSAHIDVCATIESLLRPCIKEILRLLFNNDVDDARFGQEILNSVNQLGKQLCAVLRYCIRGGQADLETVAWRFASGMLEDLRPPYRYWMFHGFIPYFRTYSSRIPQPPDSEILPLLVYKDAPTQTSMRPSTPAHQPAQAQSEAEPMETETTEERTTNFDSLDDGEEIPETFPGHETLPSDWVPIIARDGVRQRRQLQMQGMANGGVATFSDAYLGVLPTKRRKVIEQKPRLLVSPTPNHSAITASMERLVREGVSHAGVEEVDGAAAAVAVDPGVRRAFGQAIRDCLNPRRYGTPDFPDPLRFPNATKYFADQERSQK